MGFIEKFGRGIALMRRALHANHNPEPVFEARSIVTDNYVRVILRKRP